MAQIQRIERASVTEEVLSQLTRRLTDGEWPVGTAIPSLRSLAAQFGVSPLTVREALRVLQSQGFVEARQGSGTFVLSNKPQEAQNPWNLEPREVSDFLDLLEAREWLESHLIRLAVERRTDAQAQAIMRHAARLEEGRADPAAFVAADVDFHMAIAEAANNGAFMSMMAAVRAPLEEFIERQHGLDREPADNIDQVISDHLSIAEAINAQELGNCLEVGMRNMMERNRRQFLRLQASGYFESAARGT